MDDKDAEKSMPRDYEARAKEHWGETGQWAEYEARWAGRTDAEKEEAGSRLMALFSPFARMRAEGADPSCDEAQRQVEKIRSFIDEHYYTCTREVLAGLGQAYGAGGDFTRNIDAAAGPGAAEFASAAVRVYCEKN